MSVILAGARIDERGKATGGAAGDQKQTSTNDWTGEVSLCNWYKHSKGWTVIRAKSDAARLRICENALYAIANPHIGYDQSENRTLYNAVKRCNWDCSKVNKNVETDCAQLVRVCVLYAGINTPDFYTANEISVLRSTGAFEILTDKKYTESDKLLKKGDILCTNEKGHTVVVVTDGEDAYMDITVNYCQASLPILLQGMTGSAVRAMQILLLDFGYNLGKDGADGDFGPRTAMALQSFQRAYGMNADAVCGKKSWHYLICREV